MQSNNCWAPCSTYLWDEEWQMVILDGCDNILWYVLKLHLKNTLNQSSLGSNNSSCDKPSRNYLVNQNFIRWSRYLWSTQIMNQYSFALIDRYNLTIAQTRRVLGLNPAPTFGGNKNKVNCNIRPRDKSRTDL